ncbi:DUF1329 domain-containing protein [Thalassotalea nanhaiensis]|uniref:DUF1329 domain-containing protein n=1 Tax=Thalassotalea nanhaiensis TaxID=3065648 RepID=A0ABY9TDN7_9GAMM|nr:DUF1329 domain-containing protein [Colwelliaceae bacterium SQ345]
MKFNKTVVALIATTCALYTTSAVSKISAADAAKLGSELTPVGAERAANADGSIPEWTGGMTTAPEAYKGEGTTRIDPFADEKPLFTIDASNYKQYEAKLSAGQKQLFAKHPDTFKMPIYATHRTAAAPQWVYDKTKSNALNAETTAGGDGVANAFGGYPFPVPKNGHEAIWNHSLRWTGQGSNKKYKNLTVYGNGSSTLGQGEIWESFPYYNPESSVEDYNGNIQQILVQYSLPVRRKGEVILVRDPVNAAEDPRQAWQYIPGQRRVRRAPTIAFDTPNTQFAGQATFDDSFMFNGSTERYNWELKGKQEMYISYNNNALFVEAEKGDDAVKQIATPYHPNPEFARWELHRVWVVEATLKEDKRHVYAKRTFYIDEDTWMIASTDIYDGRGNLWRAGFANFLNAYDVPLTAVRATWHTDFQNGNYAFNELDYVPVKFYQGEKDKFFTPGQVRKLSKR